MELKAGDLSKILIFLFILLVGLVGTYLEFRKPKKEEEEIKIDTKKLNEEILEELKKDESSHL
ncbi:MAG: hypothetical protein C6H99_01550 [Epsilonproteobacteria bacterium]|nr:hypothetical protein [Campylobacterota bacterium]NPA63920.1 hypothetical protein [Campylobacterota bacterium]